LKRPQPQPVPEERARPQRPQLEPASAPRPQPKRSQPEPSPEPRARLKHPEPSEAVTEQKKPRVKELPPPEPEEPDETAAPAEEDRPRRKKKKKRRRHKEEESSGVPGWVWPVASGSIIFLTIVLGIVVVGVVGAKQPLVLLFGIVFFVMMIISTVILVLSMFISSAIVGGMEFGEAQIVIPKAFALLCVVNLIGLMPCVGWIIALPIWLIGCMLVFRLELWEARVLVAVNWILNALVKMFVFAVVVSALQHAGPGGGDEDRPRPVLSGQQSKDAKAIEALGGECDTDEESGKDVGSVMLSGSKATDADLVHLKGFPKLHELDLSDTAITDAGLAHLEGLSELRSLNLAGTRVTDAGLAHLRGLARLQELNVANTRITDKGIRDLRQALPRLRVSRQEE
jgi:hypothetical protein